MTDSDPLTDIERGLKLLKERAMQPPEPPVQLISTRTWELARTDPDWMEALKLLGSGWWPAWIVGLVAARVKREREKGS